MVAIPHNKPVLLKPATNLDALPRIISFQEYLKLYDSIEGARTEWVAGMVEVYAMSISLRHQLLLAFLGRLFDEFLALHTLGIVVLAGYPMYMGEENPAREPDLMVVLNEHQDRLKTSYLEGAADLVVEIASPESVARGRGDKFIEYERFGVREYWLIDPFRREAKVHSLSTDGFYQDSGLDEKGRLVSKLLPGFVLTADVLWQENLPRGAAILALIEEMKS